MEFSLEEKIEVVECTYLRVSPFQPRRVFANQELEELAASICEVGLIHPPVVRKIESGGKVLYYELVAGERRWRAAQLAGHTHLSVLVRETSDEDAAKATLIENVQRVNLDPIETAEAYKSLMHTFRMTQDEIAQRVGKKRSTVANYLRLLMLPEPIRAKLSNAEISMGHAKAILSLEDPALQANLVDKIQDKSLTVRETENLSRKMAKRSTPQDRDPHIEELEERLHEFFGTKAEVHCAHRGGKVVLHYYSLEDLDRLIALLIQGDSLV